MNDLQKSEMMTMVLELWPKCSWLEARVNLFKDQIHSYDPSDVRLGLKEHALKYNQEPSFKVLLNDIRSARNRRRSFAGSDKLMVYDEQRGEKIRWFAHGRVWTLFTTILSHERQDGTCTMDPQSKVEQMDELESLGAPYDVIRRDHMSWSR